MIDHETRGKDGTWGVSHNTDGVLLKVCSFAGIDRVRICAEEVDDLIAELEHHKAEMLAGAWCGSPMGTPESGSDDYADSIRSGSSNMTQPKPDCYASINIPLQPLPSRVKVLQEPNSWGECWVEYVSGPFDGKRRYVDPARLYNLELKP